MPVEFLRGAGAPGSDDANAIAAERFCALIRPHLPVLYRVAYRFAGSQSDAEDLVQELLARLYARGERLQQIEALRPWLARALHNLYVDQRRSLARSPHGHLQVGEDDKTDSDISWLPQDPSNDPAVCTEAQLLGRQLEELVAQLPEEQRVVVVLHDIEGYQLEEAAGIIGVAVGTVKSRLFRAHERLRVLLRRRNLSPADVVSSNEYLGFQPSAPNSIPQGGDDAL